MPWCDDCNRFWNPNTMGEGGSCPTCGRVIGSATTTDEAKAPWHFKLLVAATVAYLGWRAVQGVQWVLERV